MPSLSLRTLLGCAALLSLVATFVQPGALPAQDDEADPVFLFGSGSLTPPEGAANQEASGSVHLLQKAERNALHIRVGHLAPGVTFDVRATRGETSESIGSITTHDGTPPPPRCFKAKLTVPVPVDPAGGDGAGGFHRRGDAPSSPRGYALFNLDRESTKVSYWIGVRGLGEITSAKLLIGDAATELEVDGKGSLEVTAEQVAALVAGAASVSVVGSGDAPVTVVGKLEVCFSDRRTEIAARKAGRGTLRLDTGRGDTLPLAAATVADLVGVTFSVVNPEGAVMLAGSVAELIEGGHHKPGGDGHPGADEDCESNLARPDPAPDADAAGEVEIEGEELEVEVWRLAASAVYDVVLTEPTEGGASATIGQLKTGRGGAADQEFVAQDGVALPFGKTKISELVSHKVDIKNAEGVTVLTGALAATACAAEASRTDFAGGGGALPGAAPVDAYFQIDEVHDASFLRGDANDDGKVDLADAVSVLFFLFQGGSAPYCADGSDANDNGVMEISDPILILRFLFQGEASLAAPFPASGYDATPDALFCTPISS